MDRFRSTWRGLGRKKNDEGDKNNGNPIAILTSSTVGSIIRNKNQNLKNVESVTRYTAHVWSETF